jgi:hypothetical protein
MRKRIVAAITGGVWLALLGSVMLAGGAGCASGLTVDRSAASSSAFPPAVVASSDVDADLVYDPDGPADDIVGYPSVVYGGVTIYFVEGRWYRYGKNGWGYLRSEPAELARLREMHEREPRVARRPDPPGVAERQGP